MECLLVHTIYVRTRSRLSDLKQELQVMLKDVECKQSEECLKPKKKIKHLKLMLNFAGTLAGSPAILSIPILQPCLRAELLLVTVDTHTGMLQCHVPQYDAPLVPDLTGALNTDHSRLPNLISELRLAISYCHLLKTEKFII